jgi:arylsulfatase A-like enzyme
MTDQKKHPNIILMYADDLGYGDVSCYGATRLATPNIDRLASEGLLFWQGYATAATCTPSRYSLLTGSYPWRNPRASILRGDAPQLIPSGSPTLPGMLQKAGYTTGVVGKWHLGLGNGDLDWNSTEMQGTPNDVGFEYSYILAATNDRTPCVYVDNRRVDNLDPDDPLEVNYDKPFPDVPTAKTHPELLKIKGHGGCIVNGIPRIGHMRGGNSAVWDDETMCDVFLDKALSFVEQNKNEPFFLYYAFHEPHAPRIPSPRFSGATDLGPRGDVIVELDWCVGQVLDRLEKLGLKEDTIVIFSSDNGPALWDAYEDKSIELAKGHKPAGPLRGGKYSSYDGGTRVPFIVSWPGTVMPGKSDALVCQMDFYASFAAMLNQSLAEEEGPDSINVLDALLGRGAHGRNELVVEGNRKNTILRSGDWAYIPPKEGPATHYSGYDLGNCLEPQLYELSQDIGQVENVSDERSEVLAKLSMRLNQIINSNKTR